MAEAAPKLLSDDNVRRFITDGFLILSPDVPGSTHVRIDERLLWLLHKESNPGNNVLPIVPEMYDVLNSSVVRGALTSILGPGYVLHPHRFVHNNEPGKIDEDGAPRVGEGSRSFVGWHQDDHSPLARPRHHYPRYAMILYYPQDTPVERGPTQVIPATHFSRSHSEGDRSRGIQATGPAGTCVLTHFDIVHGGSLNLSDRTRNMVKFVFARCSEPVAPAWDNRAVDWVTPASHLAPVENTVVWRNQWDWMRGHAPSPNHSFGPEEISSLIHQFRDEEPIRQRAIYTLALAGATAVKPLCNVIVDADSRSDAEGFCGWNEGAVVMEDAAYALAAIGTPAVGDLTSMLRSKSAWTRINAAFALGEIGPRARKAMPALVRLLRDDSHAVVRTALDAIGQIGVGGNKAVSEIKRLLSAPNEDVPDSWIAPQRRKWTGLGQVRLNAVMALLRMGDEANGAEEWLGDYLGDDCGYVGGFGIEFLLRHKTPIAQDAALQYLYRRRWDNTLRGGVRTF